MVTLEYDGGAFVGWQRQDNGPSVQQAVETAVARFCGDAVAVHGAGRTDAGVHARGQVAHFDLARDAACDTVRDAVNFHLRPAPVAVLAVKPVDGDFHARFSAVERVYEYRILNRRPPPALDRDRVWWIPRSLNAPAMATAATVLVGRHDFSTFRAAQCQARSPVKTLDALDVRRDGETVWITARARSFLHHQVRNMVGTLRWVGEGRWGVDDVRAALEAGDRTRGGPTAPANGLTLMAVNY